MSKKSLHYTKIMEKFIPYDNEIWKDMKNHKNYKISNLGRIFSMPRRGGGGFKKKTLCKNGYYYVSLIENSKQKTYALHRLIAENFIENKDNKKFVDHINRIKTDNRINNLRWVTPGVNNLNKKLKGSIYKNKCKHKDTEYLYYRVKIGKKNMGSYKTYEEAENKLNEIKDKYKTYEEFSKYKK